MTYFLPWIQLAGAICLIGWLLFRLWRLLTLRRAKQSLELGFADLVLVAAVALWALRLWAVEPFWVTSRSMQPTLMAGEVFLALKRPLWRGDPQPPEIVVFRHAGATTDLVKRLGKAAEYSLPELKKEQYYVFGDNRENSRDSRAFGPILREEIKGRALLVIYPPSKIRWLR